MRPLLYSLLASALFLSVVTQNSQPAKPTGKPKQEIFKEAVAIGDRTLSREGSYQQRDQYQSSKYGLNRNTFWYLLALYGLGDQASVAKAHEILDLILPKGGPQRLERAGDMFTHAAAVTFYRLNAARLPAALGERARQDIAARVKAIEEHYYPQRLTNHNMGHTNYPMMYLEAFVLGSEAVGDAAARKKAYEAFNDFCDYWLENGVTEYNATTYYKINLRSISNIATAARDAQIRRRAAAFAELLWFETALHYWPARGWLTGANSRTYTYPAGIGGTLELISQFLTGGVDYSRLQPAERLLKQKPGALAERFWRVSTGESVFIALMDYEVPQYIREVATEKVRTEYRGLWTAPEVSAARRGHEGEGQQRVADGEFGHQYGKDRYTFIEPAYALSTGGAHYAHQDRALVADFAGEKDMVSISSQINTRLPLESKDEFLSFLGNNRHVPTGSAAVQDRNAAVLLYDLTPPGNRELPPIVAPLLLLPANAEQIHVNDRETDASPGVHPLKAGDVLYLAEGDVYAALRFVEAAAGFGGYQPTYHYRLDGNFRLRNLDEEIRENAGARSRTLKVGALSVVLYHGAPKRLTEKNVRAGFVVEMGTKKEYPTLADFRKHIERETRITQSFTGGVWEVIYKTGARELAIKKDLSKDLILDKRVNGVRFAPPMHETNFSRLKGGVVSVKWKGKTHSINLNR